MILFVVGKIVEHPAWELQGIYTSEEGADQACTTLMHFVGPVEADAPIPDPSTPWPHAYYPRAKTGSYKRG